MKKSSNPIIAILIGLILVVVLIAIPGIFLRRGGDFGWVMGPGMMGRNFGYHLPFGGVGMFFMWFIPLLVLGLLIVGAVASIISLARPRNPEPPAAPVPPPTPVVPATTTLQNCQNCGRVVEPDWVACPYCGAPQKS